MADDLFYCDYFKTDEIFRMDRGKSIRLTTNRPFFATELTDVTHGNGPYLCSIGHK
jgi:hypothetical protein